MKPTVLQLAADILSLLLFALCIAAAPARADDIAAGERIYRAGELPSGALLSGRRETAGSAEGGVAACVNCHRRSGLGSAEGRFLIPPITGKYLFRPHGDMPEDVDFRYGPAFHPELTPYDEAGVARAIREGVGRNGRPLDALMPRFDLDDAAMATLISYLKTLSADRVPGVSDDTLHFATIITPDADPARRRAMLDVLERFFADKNEFIRGGVHPMRAAKQVMYRVTRKWRLHVWELAGAPSSWEAQLRERLAAEPVFAVISGLGGKTWEPVHRFCEHEAIPCILPNVDLPVVAEKDFYSIYFSRAVLLEAELIAHAMRREARQFATRRVIEIFREEDIGREAAQALHSALQDSGVPVQQRAVGRGDRQAALARALADVRDNDVVVLWLRPPDLAALPQSLHGEAFASGLMGGLEHAPLPPAWRRGTRLAYPFDLPEQRKVRMNFSLGWFTVRHIDVVDERLQSDTYLACRILAESLGDMLDSFVRDYLVEQVETMLSKRLVNGYYPRLGLAPGTRFASKGGYLARFAGSSGDSLVADGTWTVP